MAMCIPTQSYRIQNRYHKRQPLHKSPCSSPKKYPQSDIFVLDWIVCFIAAENVTNLNLESWEFFQNIKANIKDGFKHVVSMCLSYLA